MLHLPFYKTAVIYAYIITVRIVKNNIEKGRNNAEKPTAFWYVLAKKRLRSGGGKTKICLKNILCRVRFCGILNYKVFFPFRGAL